MSPLKDLDVEELRIFVRLGGLDLPADRAAKLLPVVNALLKGCDKLVGLELCAKGGAGAQAPWGGVK
jgi:hypothetical protein